MNLDHLCPGCMQELENPNEPCPSCGYLDSEYEKTRNSRTLSPFTILAGKYLIGRTLGEGGFGITYLAMDLNRTEVVAIKEYFPVSLAVRDTLEGNMNLSFVKRGSNKQLYQYGLENFTKEANNLIKLHALSGVVEAKDFFYENQTAYLVMEYLSGITLKQYLLKKDRPISEKNALKIMRPVLFAIAQIHQKGIIHRDISPENIMLGWDGRVTLIDFGAARVATGTETQSLTIVLKHGYAPIEQYQSRGKQGPWTDIYAICATLYRMISGVIPMDAVERFTKDTLLSLKLLGLQNAQIQVSENVSDAIQKGLAIKAEQRYQSIEVLLSRLYQTPVKTGTSKEQNWKENIKRKEEIQREEAIQRKADIQRKEDVKRNEDVKRKEDMQDELDEKQNRRLLVILVISISALIIMAAYVYEKLFWRLL